MRHFIRAATVLTTVFCSCILDAGQAPDFPAYLVAVMECSEYGEPLVCGFTSDNRYGLAGAGNHLLFFELRHGRLMGNTDLGIAIVDLAGSPDAGEVLVLSDSTLHVVNVSGFELATEVPLACGAIAFCVSQVRGDVWVLHSDGYVSRVDMSTWEVVSYSDTGTEGSPGILASSDGKFLFAGNTPDCSIWKLTIPDLELTAKCEVYESVEAMFPCGDGMICAIVEQSNEIWFINESTCFVDYMMTFPGVPVCGASIHDGNFAYAGIPGSGLVVCSSSGELVMRTVDYGLPVDIAVSPEGWNTLVCSAEQMSVIILEE